MSSNQPRLLAGLLAACSTVATGHGELAHAQTSPGPAVIQFKYVDYRESQKVNDDRMRVHAPMAYFRAPIAEVYEVEGSFVLDSMSGASAFYLDTLTGASGSGVNDTRRAEDIKVTRYFEGYSLSLGGRVSDEDDYLSRGGSVEAKFWTPDKNTVFAIGVAADSDQIGSTLAPSLFEKKRTQSYLLGVTQIIDPNSLVQSNLTFTTGDGFYTDPYKTLDNRPRSREQWAWLTRYRRYIESAGAALHLDYRLYGDTWGLLSNMVEASWYQPVGRNWMVRPLLRYYTQNAADFFFEEFPPEKFDQFISYDQRLSAFGSLSLGLKTEADLGSGFLLDLGVEFYQQREELTAGDGSGGIASFFARTLVLGLQKKF